MNIEELKSSLGEYAKDTKINLSKILTTDGAPSLNQNQIFGIALASAYATKIPDLIECIISESTGTLSDAEKLAAQTAVTAMAMNNIYYRFVHLVGGDYSTLPANLRMMSLNNHGIDKVDFEMYCLAVSAINGCGMCMESHAHHLTKAGVSIVSVQSVIRIASVINSAAQALFVAQVDN